MSGQRLDDAQLTSALHAIAPAEAPPGLRARVLELAATTPQRRALPSSLAAFLTIDPTNGRRTLLLAAAILLLLAVSGLAAAGAMLFDHRADPLGDLTVPPPAERSVDPAVDPALAAPADLPSFVRSAYDAMPELAPMMIEFVRDDATMGRIYVDASGAIRQEEYASAAATSPETYQVLKGTAVAETIMVDGQPRFYEQAERIGEDPRVFVYATLGAASGGGPLAPGCEAAVSPGETYGYEPASGWTHIAVEPVAGRPAHHVKCADRELWIDPATRLTLRSRGVAVDESGLPIEGGFRTVEVTSIVTGPQPAALFDLARPAGVEAISGQEHECATNPFCLASSEPAVTPPPAAGAARIEVDDVIRGAIDVTTVPAFELVVSQSNGNYPDSTIRSFSDGGGRFRVEDTGQVGTVWESTTVTLTGPDGVVGSQQEIDGTVTWHKLPARGAMTGYPLRLPEACASGWVLVGTDMILGSPADHVRCADGADDPDWWIDRELGLVVRVQGPVDDQYGTSVREVTAIRFAAQPPELFAPPAGTDVMP